jgi:hypothetical protein
MRTGNAGNLLRLRVWSCADAAGRHPLQIAFDTARDLDLDVASLAHTNERACAETSGLIELHPRLHPLQSCFQVGPCRRPLRPANFTAISFSPISTFT